MKHCRINYLKISGSVLVFGLLYILMNSFRPDHSKSTSLDRPLTDAGNTIIPSSARGTSQYSYNRTDAGKSRSSKIEPRAAALEGYLLSVSKHRESELDSDELESRIIEIIYKSILSESDPWIAAILLEELDGSRRWLTTARKVAANFAKRNPSSGLSWLDEMKHIKEPDSWRMVKGFYTQSWGKTNPSEAIDYVTSLPNESEFREYFARQAILGVAENDFSSAWELALTDGKIVENHTRSALISDLIGVLGNKGNFSLAAELVTSEDIDGLGSGAASNLLSNWIHRDPQESAKWIETLPSDYDPPLQAHALVSSWVNRDPDAANNWIIGLKSGTLKDGAITAAVPYFAKKNPAIAQHLLSLAGNQELRRELQKSIAPAFDLER